MRWGPGRHAYSAAAGQGDEGRLSWRGRGGRPRRGCWVSGSGENNVPLNLEEQQQHILPAVNRSVDKAISFGLDHRMTQLSGVRRNETWLSVIYRNSLLRCCNISEVIACGRFVPYSSHSSWTGVSRSGTLSVHCTSNTQGIPLSTLFAKY